MPDTSTTRDSLTETMRAEFNEWMDFHDFVSPSADPNQSTARPSIFAAGGLPAGWQVRAHASEPSSWSSRTKTLYVLVSRDRGGWALLEQHVRYGDPDAYPTLKDYRADFADVYIYALGAAQALSVGQRAWGVGMESMLRSFIATQYNRDDPTEAAEAMLVALGAQPQFLPAALL